MTGIEPVTSSLPRTRSTPEPHGHCQITSSSKDRFNQLPSLADNATLIVDVALERETGFEPATLSLEG